MAEILDITKHLIVDYRAREWCKLPYPNHLKGCPNFGKKYTCPPLAPLIEGWLGNYKKLWLVCVPFNLAEHMESMLEKHPHWTERQARCLLYWQPKVNKELEFETYQFASRKGTDCVLNGVTYCPEAMGVHVLETAKLAGLPIERKPIKTVYKISLVKV